MSPFVRLKTFPNHVISVAEWAVVHDTREVFEVGAVDFAPRPGHGVASHRKLHTPLQQQ